MKLYVVTKHIGPPPCMLFPTDADDDDDDDDVDDNVDDTDNDDTIIVI